MKAVCSQVGAHRVLRDEGRLSSKDGSGQHAQGWVQEVCSGMEAGGMLRDVYNLCAQDWVPIVCSGMAVDRMVRVGCGLCAEGWEQDYAQGWVQAVCSGMGADYKLKDGFRPFAQGYL